MATLSYALNACDVVEWQ